MRRAKLDEETRAKRTGLLRKFSTTDTVRKKSEEALAHKLKAIVIVRLYSISSFALLFEKEGLLIAHMIFKSLDNFLQEWPVLTNLSDDCVAFICVINRISSSS